MVTYKTDGPWGPGKGALLTPAEVDQNFYEAVQRILALEENPPTAVSIQSADVVGNLMTITLTDATVLGPFTLPTAMWRDVGEWTANTVYTAFSIVKYQGSVYLVLRNHVSDPVAFDPSANDGEGNNFYSLILSPSPQAYDVAAFWQGLPPVDGSLVMQHVVSKQFWLPGTFTGSVACLATATTAVTFDFEVTRNDEIIGHIHFEPDIGVQGDGSQLGSFVPVTPTTNVQLYPQNRLNVFAPTLDPPTLDVTARHLSLTFVGTAGLVP
jgi:hypothetical protein